MPRIFIVTGEASGDVHGGNLAKAIRQLSSETILVGVGGEKMIEAGVQLVPGIERVDAIGVPGMTHLRKGIKTLWQLKRYLRQEPFDVVVFIDSPGMNLRLAKTASKVNRRVVYYIAPQIWAWGARRLKIIKQVVDRMIVILPFEEALYQKAGVLCEFVGHPLLDVVKGEYQKEELRRQFGTQQTQWVLGLLPGSREHEVRHCLPVMLEAAKQLMPQYPNMQCILARSSTVPVSLVQSLVTRSGLAVTIVDDLASEVMAAADFLFTASGTATLQAAIIGTPMIIVYRVPWVTYYVGRMLLTIPYIGLVNIVAGRLIVPELIQGDMTPERLRTETIRLLTDSERVTQMKQAFHQIRETLGDPGASRRTAQLVLAEAQR